MRRGGDEVIAETNRLCLVEKKSLAEVLEGLHNEELFPGRKALDFLGGHGKGITLLMGCGQFPLSRLNVLEITA